MSVSMSRSPLHALRKYCGVRQRVAKVSYLLTHWLSPVSINCVHDHCQFSAVNWKPNFMLGLTAVLTRTIISALTTAWLLLLPVLRVLAVLGLYATLMSIRSSSLSSPSSSVLSGCFQATCSSWFTASTAARVSTRPAVCRIKCSWRRAASRLPGEGHGLRMYHTSSSATRPTATRSAWWRRANSRLS